MLYITNHQFVENYFQDIQDVDSILYMFNVLENLLKKYWKRIKNEKFVKIIGEQNEETSYLIKLLDKVWKLTIKDVKSIISLLKEKYSNYTKYFDIELSDASVLKDIEKVLYEKFWKADYETKNLEEDVWINIRGESYKYKRTLNKDLNRLL